MVAKRNHVLKTPVKIVLCLLMAIISGCLLYSSAKDVMTMFQLKEQIAENNAQIAKLEGEQTSLENQLEKLQDPEYLKYMVRGKYLLTKDGEQVFKLPTSDSDS